MSCFLLQLFVSFCNGTLDNIQDEFLLFLPQAGIILPDDPTFDEPIVHQNTPDENQSREQHQEEEDIVNHIPTLLSETSSDVELSHTDQPSNSINTNLNNGNYLATHLLHNVII